MDKLSLRELVDLIGDHTSQPELRAAVGDLLNENPDHLLVHAESRNGVRAVYIYVNPRRERLRRIRKHCDINDGTVDLAWLDIDDQGHPIGLELIIVETVEETPPPQAPPRHAGPSHHEGPGQDPHVPSDPASQA